MRRHGHGANINFSSTYGNGIDPENAVNRVPVTYCAAKGAIRGFTTSLARDVAPEIRVNALAPGPISGNWEQEWGVAPEHIEETKAMNPMKRFGDPREIAETVLFLASDGASYIDGQVVHVEGGWVPADNTRRHRRSQAASLADPTVQSDRYHEARETWIRACARYEMSPSSGYGSSVPGSGRGQNSSCRRILGWSHRYPGTNSADRDDLHSMKQRRLFRGATQIFGRELDDLILLLTLRG